MLFFTVWVSFQTFMLTSCTSEITILPISVTLSRTSAILSPGETLILTADIIPDEVHNKAVVWSSSNPAIAEVSNGVITAFVEGTTKITATTNSGNLTAFCQLTVAYPVSGVTIDRSPKIMATGQQMKLTAIVSPDDAPDKTLLWSSNNPDVATVNNGIVTAITPGMVTVTATTVVGQRTATFDIRVFPENFKPVTLNLRSTFNSWFSISGSSSIIVDWGDDATLDMYDISETLVQRNHNYNTQIIPYTITILEADLKRLNCCDANFRYYLNLSSLEINEKSSLTTLYCSHTGLSDLDVSGCDALNELDCSFNQLSRLDMRNNIHLNILYCQSNLLSAEALNALFNSLHQNTGYKIIYIGDNPGTATCDQSIATNKGWIVY